MNLNSIIIFSLERFWYIVIWLFLCYQKFNVLNDLGNRARAIVDSEQCGEGQNGPSHSQEQDNTTAGPSGAASRRTRARRAVNSSAVSQSATSRSQNTVYDPAQPTSDEEENAPESLRTFLATQVQGLKVSLENHVKESQAQFLKNISGHLAYMDKKLTQKSERKVLKSAYNQKHYDRIQVYKQFLFDTKYALESDNIEDARTHIDACFEAFMTYEKEIVLADSSAVGWELIDRLGEGSDEKDARAVERKILDERRARKRTRQDGQREDSSVNVKGNGGNPKFGPCVWCGGMGHGYKFCPQWKDDVANNRAVFDTSARKWIRAESRVQ